MFLLSRSGPTGAASDRLSCQLEEGYLKGGPITRGQVEGIDEFTERLQGVHRCWQLLLCGAGAGGVLLGGNEAENAHDTALRIEVTQLFHRGGFAVEAGAQFVILFAA